MSSSQNPLEWAKYENKIDELLKETRYYFSSSDYSPASMEKVSSVQISPEGSRMSPGRKNQLENKKNRDEATFKPAINVRKTIIRSGYSNYAVVANLSQRPTVYHQMHSANMYSKSNVSAFPAKIWISLDESSESKSRVGSPNSRNQRRLRFASGEPTGLTEQVFTENGEGTSPHTASEIILETLRNPSSSPRHRPPDKSQLELLREQFDKVRKGQLQSVFSSEMQEGSGDQNYMYAISGYGNKRSVSPTTGWRSHYRVSDPEYYRSGYQNRSPSLLRNLHREVKRMNSSKEGPLSLQSQGHPEKSSIILQSENSPRCESPHQSSKGKLPPKQRLHPSLDADVFRSYNSRTERRDQEKGIILKTTQSLNDDPDDMLLGYLGLKQNVKASRTRSAAKAVRQTERSLRGPDRPKNIFRLNPKISRPCNSQSVDHHSHNHSKDSSTDRQNSEPADKNVVQLENIDPMAIAQAIQTAKKKVSVLMPPTLTGSNTKFLVRSSISGRPRTNSVDFSQRGSKQRVSVVNQLNYLPPQTGLSLLSEVLGYHKNERQNLVKSLQETEAAQLKAAFKLTEAFSSARNRYSPVDEYLHRMSKMGKLHASNQQN